ncbi:hypothetical protein BDR07DRAFT_1614334 [Suillus spraguei]|nr:hypothetical protein BDR07DRAFT_1614334 [Suillus spraguei]
MCIPSTRKTHFLPLTNRMETKYSSDHIAAAISLQTYTYVYASMAMLWTYDYVRSLQEEWTFLLQSRWTKVKGLYVATRFVPFLLLTMHLYTNFIPNENPDKCKILINVCSVLSQMSGTCSKCISPPFRHAYISKPINPGVFVLRTCALWKYNRFVLIVILTFSLASMIAIASTGYVSTVTVSYKTSTIPGITGCYTSYNLFVPFLLLFIIELGLMSLTLTHAIQSWWMASGRLYIVLVKNNIFYYTCALCSQDMYISSLIFPCSSTMILVSEVLSGVNVIASRYLHYQYHAMFQDYQFIILAILTLRMHLHLWQVDQQVHNMDALVCISLSDV